MAPAVMFAADQIRQAYKERAQRLAKAEEDALFHLLVIAFGRFNTGRHGLRGDLTLPFTPTAIRHEWVAPIVPAQRAPSDQERVPRAQRRRP